MKNIPTKAVKAVISNDKEEILLLQRSSHNNWDLPGGLLEDGEDEKDALKREILEELGVGVEIIKIGKKWKFYRPLDGKWVNVQNYTCKIMDKNIKLSDEHLDYRWVDKKDIKKYSVKDDSFFDAL